MNEQISSDLIDKQSHNVKKFISIISSAELLDKKSIKKIFRVAFNRWIENSKYYYNEDITDPLVPTLIETCVYLNAIDNKYNFVMQVVGFFRIDYFFAVGEKDISLEFMPPAVFLLDPENQAEKIKKWLISRLLSIFDTQLSNLPFKISSFDYNEEYIKRFTRFVPFDVPKEKYSQIYNSLKFLGINKNFFSDYVGKINTLFNNNLPLTLRTELISTIANKSIECNDSKTAVPAKYISSSVNITQSNGFHVQVTLNVTLRYGNKDYVGIFTKLGKNLFSEYLKGEEECCKSILSNCLDLLSYGINRIKVLCAPGLEDPSVSPDIFKTILHKCPISFDSNISLQITEISCIDTNYVEYYGNGKYALSKNPVIGSKYVIFSTTTYQALNDSQYELTNKSKLPTNMEELLGFCRAVGELYSRQSKKYKTFVPSITFEKPINKNLSTVRILEKEYKISDFCDSKKDKNNFYLYDAIQRLLEFALSAGSKLQVYYDCIIPVLNSLNPTEFEILKYLNKYSAIYDGRYANRIERELKGKIITDSCSIECCLNNLCNIAITDPSGSSYPLVEKIPMGRDGQISKYYSGYSIVNELFDIASPRNFSIAESSYIQPRYLKDWLLKTVLVNPKESDDLWSILRIIENMCTSHIISIAKSDVGIQFFKRFEGSDATYVQYFLENIPGCKTLAKSLYKK